MIKRVLEYYDYGSQPAGMGDEVRRIIQREIDLKEIDMVTGKRIKSDVSGNEINED